jgi:hypothetical protein
MEELAMKTNPLSQRPRLLRWLGFSLLAVLLLALTSWLALPPLVKRLATEQVEAQLGRKLSIGDIAFAPASLTLTASDLTLYEADKVTPAFSAKTLLINASAVSLLKRALVLDEAKLVEPKLHIVRTAGKDGSRYNFSDLIERILAQPPSESPLRFSLANLQLEAGSIAFDDQMLGKHVAVSALELGLPFISNLPAAVDSFVTPKLAARINGSPVALKARSKPFASSQESALALDLAQLDLASYAAFSPVPLPIVFQRGKLSSKLDLAFMRTKEQPEVTLSGTLDLADLALADKANAPLFSARAIHAGIDKLNLLTGAASIGQLKLEAPSAWVGLDRQGKLNWASLAGNDKAPQAIASAAKPAAPLPTLTLRQLQIENGSLHWSDDANALPRQTLDLAQLTLQAGGLSTMAQAAPANLSLTAAGGNGEQLEFIGQLTPATAKLAGRASISALPLAAYQPYANRALAGNIGGQASLSTLILVDGGTLKLKQLAFGIDNLQLAAGKAGGGIAASSIVLENGTLDSASREISVAAVRLRGLRGDVRRDAQGKLNLLQTLTSSAAAPPSKSAPAAARQPDWQVSAPVIALTESAIAFDDKAVTPNVQLRAEAVNLTLENASSRMQEPLKLALQAKLNRSGKLAVSGQLKPQSKSAELLLDGQNLPLVAFQPYFSQFLTVTLTSGQASTKGKLSLAPGSGGQPLAFSYNGSASLTNFRVVDNDSANEFLNWKALSFSGINARFGNPQPALTLGKIALSDFYARIIVSSQGKLNLQDIIASHKSEAATVTAVEKAPAVAGGGTTTTAKLHPAPAAAPAPLIQIGQTTLQNGNINFTDNFIKPNYSANLSRMTGSIGALASNLPQPAVIDLRGQVDGDAPVVISGSLNPLAKPLFLDLKASAKNIELTRLTPYAAKYAGYAIDKGKLSMEVSYHIENDTLSAQNRLNLDQLTFGDKIDSPDATKLPVKLAVALLKNRRGEIDINLPISGSLSDPQFSVGGILFRVFVNLIVKAVTAPFALLGSAFGGGEELAYVEFAPGAAVLSVATQAKLDTLVKALKDRPGLKLDIAGRVDPQSDKDGLQRASLAQKLKSQMLKEQLRQGKEVAPEELVISDADKAHYLERVYKDEKFAKPRNAIGLAKSLPPAEMEQLILANTEVSAEQMNRLALRRAELVRSYLETHGEIAPERLFLLAPKMSADGIKDKGSPNRVDFALK